MELRMSVDQLVEGQMQWEKVVSSSRRLWGQPRQRLTLAKRSPTLVLRPHSCYVATHIVAVNRLPYNTEWSAKRLCLAASCCAVQTAGANRRCKARRFMRRPSPGTLPAHSSSSSSSASCLSRRFVISCGHVFQRFDFARADVLCSTK